MDNFILTVKDCIINNIANKNISITFCEDDGNFLLKAMKFYINGWDY